MNRIYLVKIYLECNSVNSLGLQGLVCIKDTVSKGTSGE